MKAKLIAILVMTLLIATALPAVSVTIKKIENDDPPALQNGAVDQEQTTHGGYGFVLEPEIWFAQGFKPTQEPLTNVQLYLFKYGDPPAGIEITVSIRDEINGSDLTTKTINADDVGITGSPTWVFFNFEDITLIPEETYYIVCRGSDGSDQNAYCWLFDVDDPYPRGEAWISEADVNWNPLEEVLPQYNGPDFCFKTYFKETSSIAINTPILNFLENHPNMVPLLQRLLQRLGL